MIGQDQKEKSLPSSSRSGWSGFNEERWSMITQLVPKSYYRNTKSRAPCRKPLGFTINLTGSSQRAALDPQ